MNNSKIKKNYRVMFLVTMIVFLLSSIMFVHTLPAFAEEVTVNAYEARLYSNAKINEDFADDSIIIIMDKNSSDVNKFHSFGIARNSQVKITDLTRIDGSADKKKYFNKDEFHQIFKIDLSEHSKENVLNEIHKYENMEGVLWVGPNYYDEPLELPIATDGTRYSNLWGLFDSGCQAQSAWNITMGSKDVRVGVIDTGIANHSDLSANLLSGWDFYNDNSITTDDLNSHGTHVAGTIGATGASLNGVIGVSPTVSLIPLQVVNEEGRWPLDAVTKAITWAINNDIDILNYSGGGTTDNEARRLAIGNFSGLFVSAAGNDGNNNDTSKYYPSDYARDQAFSSRFISVGNHTESGNRGWSSNYGTDSVSIYAPGDGILSTVPLSYNSTGYATKSGTSMATPHVSGVAALLLSLDPDLTGSELKSIIINSADNIKIDKGVVKKLNAYKAVKQVRDDFSIFNTTVLSNNEVRLDGLNVDYEGVLRIPSIIGNRKVTQINSEAFAGKKRITEVIIPATVESIGNVAFNNCVGLKKVTFEGYSNLDYINGYAFQQCYNLKSLTIPSTVTNVSYGILSFGERLTVYTDLNSDPTTWDNHWNRADWISIERPVVWGCELSADKSYVVSLTKTSTSITKPNAVNGISAPSRDGYVFGGWYINADFTGTAIASENIAKAANNVTYYAKWIPDCDVVFDFNDGSDTNYVKTIANGAKIDEPIDQPTKAGYVFKYWALSTNLNQEYDWNSVVTDNIVLEAVWQNIGNNYVVTFDLDGGVGTFNTQVLVENGSTVTRPSSPTKVGYTFSHWALTGQTSSYNFNTSVTSDITLVAIWNTTQTCTVNFDLNGGEGNFPDIIINRYKQIEKPIEDPVQVGNYFKYWALSTNLNQEYDWNTYIDKNITLVAVWEKFTHTVSLNADGGSFRLIALSLNDGDTVGEFLSNPDIAPPTKTGYTFRYWALSTNTSVAYNLNTPVTNSFTLKAIWAINTYTVSFDLAGGSGSFPAKTIKYGSTVSKPTSNPTRNGYTFKYWALSGQSTEYDFSTPVTSNITLVAIWEQNQCIAAGTLITLADGRQVPVESLTGSEMLLVWNMHTGTFDTAPILCIDKDQLSMYEVIRLYFSDGTTVDVISEHGFFDVNLNKYVYLDRHASDYIGHSFLKQNANGMVQVTLENVDLIEKTTEAYSPVTYGHLCYYVNGMLSMPGGIDGLFNIFEVDSDTMKFDTEAMADDIEQYGLFTYEELNALVPVPEVMFEAVNGQYLKVAIGKGVITLDQVRELINKYSYLFA